MTPSHQILVVDCLELLRQMPDNSVDSVVTDPPYGLSFMGKKWDYDVPAVEVWVECLRVLKPGGHLLAFAGTRTQHRMAVRIEDAGFEIRDMIAWVYGSRFSKSHNLGGHHAGWGTALKPALEPITVARKPFAGTVAANMLMHSTGALNIDRCPGPARRCQHQRYTESRPKRSRQHEARPRQRSQRQQRQRWRGRFSNEARRPALGFWQRGPVLLLCQDQSQGPQRRPALLGYSRRHHGRNDA